MFAAYLATRWLRVDYSFKFKSSFSVWKDYWSIYLSVGPWLGCGKQSILCNLLVSERKLLYLFLFKNFLVKLKHISKNWVTINFVVKFSFPPSLTFVSPHFCFSLQFLFLRKKACIKMHLLFVWISQTMHIFEHLQTWPH